MVLSEQARLCVRPQRVDLAKVFTENANILGLLSNIFCLNEKTSYVYPLEITDGYCRVWGEETQRNGLFPMGILANMEIRNMWR